MTQRLSFLCFLLLLATSLCANNVRVSDVQLPAELTVNPNNANQVYLDFTFDLAWDNSWRVSSGPATYDGVYFFVYYRLDSMEWRVLPRDNGRALTAPAGFSYSSRSTNGYIIHRNTVGSGDVVLDDLPVVGLLDGTEFNSVDDLEVRVFAIEMVYIQGGSFYLGTRTGSEEGAFFAVNTNSTEAGNAFLVPNSNFLSFGTGDGQLSFTEGPNTGTVADASLIFGFPNGTTQFWMMKYEVTEGQYVDFFNQLEPSQKALLDVTGPNGKNSDAVVDGNTISWDGPGTEMTTQASDRPLNYVSQDMVQGYLAWAGLRMPSEFEYEAACRGAFPRGPVESEFAWGSDKIAGTAYNLQDNGTASESITDAVAATGNANYAPSGLGATERPFRAGIFAASAVNPTREETGGSYYGVMELSGNLTEVTVSATTPGGTNYTRNELGNFRLQPDGRVVTTGFGGLSGWLNTATDPTKAFWALRGGSFLTGSDRLRVADRQLGAVTFTAQAGVGFRGVN